MASEIRKQKQTESELQRSCDLLQAVIEAAPVAIMGLDLDGNVQMVWNPAAEKMLGWAAEEVMGRPLPSVPEESRAEFERFRERIGEGQVISGVEVRRQRRDGSPIDYSIWASPLHDAQGRILGNIAVLVDITERKGMQRALATREKEYRTLLENIPDLIVRYDTDLRRIYVNAAWEKASGLFADEVVDVPAAEILSVPRPVNDDYVDKLRQVLETGVPQAFEFSWVNAFGATLLLEYVIVPEYDRSGKIVSVLAVGRDLTERKQAEQDRLANLRFMESMDLVNRAIQGARDLEQMMSDVLAVVLDIFTCDRAALVYPCDPDTATWYAPMERNRPEYPAPLLESGQPVPMEAEVAELFRTFASARGPVRFDPKSGYPLPLAVREKMQGIKSLLGMTLYPKVGSPWLFCVHQCDRSRIWTPSEVRLFQEVGRRLTDSLTSLLTYRNLRVSEERLNQAVHVSQTGIFDHDRVADIIYWSPEQRAIFGIGADEVVTYDQFFQQVHPDDRDFVAETIRRAQDPKGDCQFDLQHRIVRKDGEVRWVMARSRTFFDGEGEVCRAIRTVGAVSDITERMRAEENIAHLAFYDSLTGLANRRLLRDRLGRALVASSRKQLYGALLFIDLDQFKAINDSVGHDYGDLLLKEVSERLRNVLREADTISRPGGDEFVVILAEIGDDPELAAARAKTVSEKILVSLAHRYHLHGKAFEGSASIGVALFRGPENDIDELLKRSDLAMYEAKKAGRGVVRFFDPYMQAAFEKRAVLESDIRKALALGQFALHYQVRIGPDDRVLGAEALLRWSHPGRGLLEPAEFIGVCEESGLIRDIDDWVLGAACGRLKAWEGHASTRDLRISVNVSAGQFRRNDFVERVVGILEKADVDPARLEMEVTEGVFWENYEQAIVKMGALRDLGIGFVLDAFGTGYSSLSHLTRLPLSRVKVDRSFVGCITEEGNDEVVVRTIIAMGRTLGLEVVASGVETRLQYEALKRHGCEHFQGYFFGKPMPVGEFERTYADGGITG
ncbi:MAG: EAL domain-containing protein [Gammaproteobacteria bacterium]|nr:EAL domain-containing protein [Gammaproteobacteria bacterium]